MMGGPAPTDECPLQEGLAPAERQDLLATIPYALGFNLSGKSRGRVDETQRRIEAEGMLEHLARCNYIIMRKPAPPKLPY